MRRIALFTALTLLAACGDDPAPPPPVVQIGDVRVETDPLRLVLEGGADFSAERFVEIGVAAPRDPRRYYDPRDPGDIIAWQVPARAVAYDEASGALTLEGGARLTVAAGPVAGTQTLVVDAADVADAALVRLVLPRSADEPIYGFGETFDAADGNGAVREMQLRVDLDSESSLNEVHVPVPLALWPARRAGVFVEDQRPAAFDAATRPDAVLATFLLSAPGPVTAHIYAADPLDLVRRYIALTAPPALPPLWAFAPQQWRNEHRSSDEVRDDAQMMRALDVPGSVMWIDNPWQTGYNDFTFDVQRFEASAALLDELAALGYRVVVWSTPYVNTGGTTAADFEEAESLGYLVTDDRDRPFVFPWQDGPGALVDFTAPGATEWWRERIDRAIALGISGFKLDFGEDLIPELGGQLTPFGLVGGDPQTLHARYAEHYHEAYLGALPAGDGFLITRAGTYGEQAVNTAIWPGDLDSDFSRHGEDNGEGDRNVGGLPAAVAAALSLSTSGYPFFGSDIGGFREGLPTSETLIRWAQHAALGTIMQLGGGGPSHNPWDAALFDPIALSVYRTFARLHMDLVPHIYTLAVAASTDGAPVLRPARLLHPDAACDDASYFVGDDIFVAPVITEGATTRDAALPPGTWVDWWTGAATDGDGQRVDTFAAPIEILPLWRRHNRFVAMFAVPADTLEPATDAGVRSYADPSLGRELRLLITPAPDRAEIAVYDGAAASGEADADAYVLTASAGATFDVFTFDVDGRAATAPAVTAPAQVAIDGVVAAQVADEAELMACPAPGCWLLEPADTRLRIRVFVGAADAVVRVEP